ncbi:MAG: AAA family ATPase, partial [Verrucomicrobiota bacterium]
MTVDCLSINNFRCFEQLSLSDLGRVNLVVGENNSGKTTILEAIDIVCSQFNRHSIQRSLARLRDTPSLRNTNHRRGGGFDAKNIFYGFEYGEGKEVRLSLKGEQLKNSFEIAVSEDDTLRQRSLFDDDEEESLLS